MKQFKKKINSKRAASIYYAMFLLACASMVTAVVLTAARVESRRFAQSKAAQQNLLTLTSAARLLEADLMGTASSIEETYYYEDGSLDVYISPGHETDLFRTPLAEALKGYYESGGFQGTSPLSIEAAGLSAVSCRFSMEEGESRSPVLLLTFTLPEEGGLLTARYTSSRSVFSIENTADNEEKTPISSVTTTIYQWNHCEYSGGPLK